MAKLINLLRRGKLVSPAEEFWELPELAYC